MDRARVVVNAPASGSWNMAVDQALLELANRAGHITLRFYYWREPTISLGYFQSVKSRESHSASRHCDLVRRATGGGAIIHDHELTYSLCIPASNRWARNNQAIYSEVHRCLLDVLNGFDVGGRLCEGAMRSKPEPFLCFQRRAVGDVLVGNHKVCGSAQRRIHDALLQHGSCLVSVSDCAPQLPGINQIANLKINPADIVEPWSVAISRRLDLELMPDTLSSEEQMLSEKIEVARFRSTDWSNKR